MYSYTTAQLIDAARQALESAAKHQFNSKRFKLIEWRLALPSIDDHGHPCIHAIGECNGQRIESTIAI